MTSNILTAAIKTAASFLSMVYGSLTKQTRLATHVGQPLIWFFQMEQLYYCVSMCLVVLLLFTFWIGMTQDLWSLEKIEDSSSDLERKSCCSK